MTQRVWDHQFRPVEQLQAYQYVAEQIRRHIALRLVLPGAALPPERELAKIFGVGRATVQQAIGELENEGLLESRRGRRGGTFVLAREGGAESAVSLIPQLRRERGLIEEALAFRLEIEPRVAARAAVARTQQDLKQIRNAHDAASAAYEEAEFMGFDTEFHLSIARATRNRFFSEVMEQVRIVLGPTLEVLPGSPGWLGRSRREHREILDAIEARDADLAAGAMTLHVKHTDQSVRALLTAL